MILITKTSDQTRQRGHALSTCTCVCVFIKLHITTQSGPVILVILCVCVCVFILFILRGHTGERSHRRKVTQEKGHTGFLLLPSVVLALIFLAGRIQPFLSLVDRKVEFCVLTNYQSFSTTCWTFFLLRGYYCEEIETYSATSLKGSFAHGNMSKVNKILTE